MVVSLVLLMIVVVSVTIDMTLRKLLSSPLLNLISSCTCTKLKYFVYLLLLTYPYQGLLSLLVAPDVDIKEADESKLCQSKEHQD